MDNITEQQKAMFLTLFNRTYKDFFNTELSKLAGMGEECFSDLSVAEFKKDILDLVLFFYDPKTHGVGEHKKEYEELYNKELAILETVKQKAAEAQLKCDARRVKRALKQKEKTKNSKTIQTDLGLYEHLT